MFIASINIFSPLSRCQVNSLTLLQDLTVFSLEKGEFGCNCCNPLTFQPERSGRLGSIRGRAPPLKRHDKGSRT